MAPVTPQPRPHMPAHPPAAGHRTVAKGPRRLLLGALAACGLVALAQAPADARTSLCSVGLVDGAVRAAPAAQTHSAGERGPILVAQAAQGSGRPACVPPSAQSPLDEVIMFGLNPPRAADDPRFRFPQATGVISGNRVAILEREPALANHFMVWANRCVVPAREVGAGVSANSECRTFENPGTAAEKKRNNYKPNPWDLHLYPSRGAEKKTQERYWAFFTSYGKADACTRMKIWAALGDTQRAVQIGRASGFGDGQIRTSPRHAAFR